MRITSLTLTNFRAARGLSLPLDASRVLIVGLNGAGKTSIRESIRWALRGVCDGTDLKGAGAEALIPNGCPTNEASVSLALESIGCVTRTFAEHGGTAFSVEGFTGTSGTQQQALLAKLGTSPAFLDAVLETEAFTRLHHADAKALVLSLLNVKVLVPIASLTGSDSLVDTAVAREYTLEELDVAYRQAFEQRKDAKRRLTQAGVPVVPVLPDALVLAQEKIPGESLVDGIAVRLERTRGDLGVAERELGKVAGRRQALAAEYSRLEALIAAGVPQVDETQVPVWQAELAALAPAAVPIEGVQPLQVLKNRVEALSKHQPPAGCVLDAAVACKTPKKAFNERITELQAQIDAIPTEVLPAASRMAVQRLEKQIREVQQAVQIREGVRSQIAAANLRLPDLRTELAALPNTEAQEATVALLKDRIKRGEALLGEARAFTEAQAHYERSKAARAVLEAQVAELETRVEMLGPKGLRVPALAEAMGAFEARINQGTELWGWTVQIQAEPWMVLVNGRELSTYSRSERYRIGIGIQFAIAEMSGLSFAVVDEMDMLDSGNRKAFNRMVNNSPLEQIIVLATREDEQPLPEQPVPGWIFVRLANVEGVSQVAQLVAPPQMQEA